MSNFNHNIIRHKDAMPGLTTGPWKLTDTDTA